jgi:hypothetical protein
MIPAWEFFWKMKCTLLWRIIGSGHFVYWIPHFLCTKFFALYSYLQIHKILSRFLWYMRHISQHWNCMQEINQAWSSGSSNVINVRKLYILRTNAPKSDNDNWNWFRWNRYRVHSSGRNLDIYNMVIHSIVLHRNGRVGLDEKLSSKN